MSLEQLAELGQVIYCSGKIQCQISRGGPANIERDKGGAAWW
jgi:hypothetical protein